MLQITGVIGLSEFFLEISIINLSCFYQITTDVQDATKMGLRALLQIRLSRKNLQFFLTLPTVLVSSNAILVFRLNYRVHLVNISGKSLFTHQMRKKSLTAFLTFFKFFAWEMRLATVRIFFAQKLFNIN